jgi:hypothetical protein
MVSSPFLQYPKSIPTLALFGAKDRSVKKFIRIHQLETMPSTAPLHITRGSREPVIEMPVKNQLQGMLAVFEPLDRAQSKKNFEPSFVKIG